MAAKKIDVKCKKCGALFNEFMWKPGMICPACKAPNALEPIVKTFDEKKPAKFRKKSYEQNKDGFDWKKSPLMAGFLLIVIAAAWLFIMSAYFCEKKNEVEPVMTICNECKHLEARIIGSPENLPLVCTKCAKKAVFEAYECSKCGTKFGYVPPVYPEPPEYPEDPDEAMKIEEEYQKKLAELAEKYGPPTCPKCGSINDVNKMLTEKEKKEIEEYRAKFKAQEEKEKDSE